MAKNQNKPKYDVEAEMDVEYQWFTKNILTIVPLLVSALYPWENRKENNVDGCTMCKSWPKYGIQLFFNDLRLWKGLGIVCEWYIWMKTSSVTQHIFNGWKLNISEISLFRLRSTAGGFSSFSFQVIEALYKKLASLNGSFTLSSEKLVPSIQDHLEVKGID